MFWIVAVSVFVSVSAQVDKDPSFTSIYLPPATQQLPPRDFDCGARELAFSFAKDLVKDAARDVETALRLSECSGADRPEAHKTRQTEALPPDHVNSVPTFFVAVDGSDEGPGTVSQPFRSLHHARDVIRQKVPLSSDEAGQRAVVMIREGRYYLEEELTLSAQDSGVTWEAYRGEEVVLSGAVEAELTFVESIEDNVWVADLPAQLHFEPFNSMFLVNQDLREEERLPWAREPNGDPERQLQPDGYALAAGPGTAKQFHGASEAFHYEVDKPARNSSIYPVFGVDYDPREVAGWQWLHTGGDAERFADNSSFWNGTVTMGLKYNETGGRTTANFNVSGFSTANWTAVGTQEAVAHVFHDAFWGNWMFRLGSFQPGQQQLLFSEGGWQEGHGGGVSDQPFFVEGVREALDSAGEWWRDRRTHRLYVFANSSFPFGPFQQHGQPGGGGGTRPAPQSQPERRHPAPRTQRKLRVAVPRLQTIVGVRGNATHTAAGVRLVGLSFTHAAATFMEPYEVPSPGDWSIRRSGAVFAEGSDSLAVSSCRFLRVNGNALFLSGHNWHARVTDSEFWMVGDSAIATVGRLLKPNSTQVYTNDGSAVDTYPYNTTISGCHIHDVGVIGKQTSALFSAVSCNTVFERNIAYNGPRAGINLNDEFCHGHTIRQNLLFNWVRETQDHGPINTWNRAMYLQRHHKGGADGKVDNVPEWTHISQNFIMNGPSGNRDLGNMFPAVDNDDGSAFFLIEDNFFVYGGGKNYLGYNKEWRSNLIAYPGRWSGDPCVQIWGGPDHVFDSNVCVTTGTDEVVGLDGTIKGFQCRINYTDPGNAAAVGLLRNNKYYTENATWVLFCGNSTADNHPFTIHELQTHGNCRGDSVKKTASVSSAQVLEWAAKKLQVPFW